MNLTLTDKALPVTGSNRGLGHALVAAAIRRGARRVCAGSRQPMAHTDERVIPLALGITDRAQIEAAARLVDHLDVLVNNAGVGLYGDLADRTALEAHLAVNQFGPYDMAQALLPALGASHGAVVNVLSIGSTGVAADHPVLLGVQGGGALSDPEPASLLARRGISGHAVLVGPTDIEMSRGFEVPKVSPEYAARRDPRRRAGRDEEILPHPMLDSAAQSWRAGEVKRLERQFATLVEPITVASRADDPPRRRGPAVRPTACAPR